MQGLTAPHSSYIFLNTEHSRDWALHNASAETVSKFSSLIEVLLRDSTNWLVCITLILSVRALTPTSPPVKLVKALPETGDLP